MSERIIKESGSAGSDIRWMSRSIVIAGLVALAALLVLGGLGLEGSALLGILSALVVALLAMGFYFSDPESVGDIKVFGLVKIGRRVKKLEQEVDQVSKAAFRGILGKHERAQLRKLNDEETDEVEYQPGLKRECERLEALGYIRAKNESRGMQALEDKDGKGKFQLKEYAGITDDGKEYLKLYAEVAPKL
ncbi:hypothetical protein ACIGXI_10100 [Kitasatospora aureofaciens]|uniref:hypothetical protein n=1 Tax=Kitasatospora aureofaciens TaxID=1894 RepID=UPI0037CCB95C